MIYLSAGHHFKPGKSDPGAVANGYKESELTKELRDLTSLCLEGMGYPFILDRDSETLGEYLARIKPGSGSVVCEIHFNSSVTQSASGVEVLCKDDSNPLSKALAIRMAGEISTVEPGALIKNRGAKTEKDSARGRLAILNTAAGIAVLPEICFISNLSDLAWYQRNKHKIALCIAKLLVEFELKKS